MDHYTQQTEWTSTCDYHAPRKWELTSAPFLAQLAKDLTVPDMPAPQIVYQAIGVLLNRKRPVSPA